MITIIAENQRAYDILIDDLGIIVPASGTQQLNAVLGTAEVNDSVSLKTLINNGDLLISDGTSTLPLDESLNFVASFNQVESFEGSNLGDLGDVDISGVTAGDMLCYDGTQFTKVKPYYEFIIWAEEVSSLNSNSREYSFGNSATGNIGIPMPFDCEAVGMVYQAEGGTGSADVYLVKNGTNTTSYIGVGGSGAANGQTNRFATPVPFSNTDVVGFITQNVSGRLYDVRVGAVIRAPLILI
ncbi:MAG: hypothetical protein GY777_15900 [Candidatus Brocadiaceae bacterium]|nr:hypothetical protein [Candidatus Brocadiaceae bacterium]